MKASELRIGNYVKTPVGYELLVRDISIDMIVLTGNAVHGNLQKHYIEFILPIPLTNEWLVKFGFQDIPHFTIGNTKWIDLGRNRRLSVSDVGNPNLMMYIQQVDVNGKTINDLICLHNWDYDKHLYVHQLQNLYFALTGEELTLK